MAIINSSRKFEGGDMSSNAFGSIIKSGLPTINFRDEQNKGGVKVFILGSYKEDVNGDGVWYKVVKTRDQFGMETKEKFAIQPNCPVQWFDMKVKTFAPNYAAVTETTVNGAKKKIYPSYGRVNQRVLFNAAYVSNCSLGAHVLELPQWKCAEVLDRWQKDPTKPMLTDWQKAIPVGLRLDKSGTFPTWVVDIESFNQVRLPEALADCEYLHNLDDVVLYPSKAQLYEKLRMITPKEIFDKCMAEYVDESVRHVVSTGYTAQEDDIPYTPAPSAIIQKAPRSSAAQAPGQPSQPAAATAGVAPAFNIPKSSTRRPVAEPTPAPAAEQHASDEGSDERPPAPMMANRQSAAAFLRRPSAVVD